jgi:hypothetical protein
LTSRPEGQVFAGRTWLGLHIQLLRVSASAPKANAKGSGAKGALAPEFAAWRLPLS